MKRRLLYAAITIVFLIIVFYILRAISDHFIHKNRKKYFNTNKKLSNEIKNEGESILNHRTIYNQYIQELGLNTTIKCSNSVVSNSSINPVKYAVKYSLIDNNINDIERLDYILNYLKSYSTFLYKVNTAKSEYIQHLPLFQKIFCNKTKLVYYICDVDYEITTIRRPFIRFSYTSPAGRAQHSNIIVINESIIKGIIENISGHISKKGHSSRQRSLMSNDLREAIKKRDNYTCCECGNSVFNEPNLLLEVDHIIPVSKGGKTEASNLQTLCWRCNRKKSNK